jgi:hypothetical protein
MMIISMVSPHTNNNGNTVSSILLAHGLAELKRKVLFTHIKPQSQAFERYLGLKAFEDKTSTPTQLVKLMREGAIKAEDIGDYCKNVYDFLDVFTTTATNFSTQDMSTLLEFLTTSDTPYDYLLFDIDADSNEEEAQKVINKSNIIILNVTSSFLELEAFNAEKERIAKMCKGKKVILLCSAYDSKAAKLKDITKLLGVNTSLYTIRHNSYVKWACNQGKLTYLFKQGKTKNADVMDIFRDVSALAIAVSKAKIAVGKSAKGVFK